MEVYELPIWQSVRGRVDEGYDLPDGKRGMTGCTGYLSPNPLPEQTHTVEEIYDLGIGHFDLIVALSTRDYVRRSLRKLSQDLPGDDLWSKLIVCDGEDGSYVDRELLHDYNPRVFFKRELSREYALASYGSAYGRPTYPLQFGAFLRSLPDIDDEYKSRDLFVSLGRTNPIRDRFLAACLDAIYEKEVCHPDSAWLATNSNSPLFLEHKYGSELHDLTEWTDYMKRQAWSKIGASLVGFGRDCLHSWELFSFATLALYQDTGLHIPHPFVDGKHCQYITEADFPNLAKIIAMNLYQEEERVRIARAGRDWCRLHHSTQARATYMVDIAMKVIGGEKIRLEEYGL